MPSLWIGWSSSPPWVGPACCHLPMSAVELSVCRSVGLSAVRLPSVVLPLPPPPPYGLVPTTGHVNGLVPTTTQNVKQNLMVTKVNTSFIALEHPIGKNLSYLAIHSFQKDLNKSEFYKQHASAIFYGNLYTALMLTTLFSQSPKPPLYLNKTYVCQNQHNVRVALL